MLVGEDAQRAPIVHGSGVDEPLLYNAPGSTLVTPLSDGLGSITEELDANGVVFRARRYLAYGDIVETVGTGPTSYAFTARVFDDATGLQYSRARHYDPKVGRFLQQDPIGFAGGDANLYAYTFANPVNYTDPSGEIVPALVLAPLLVRGALLAWRAYSIAARVDGLLKTMGDYGDIININSRGNVADSGLVRRVEEVRSQAALLGNPRPDRCQVLQELIDSGEVSAREAQSTQKAWGCRPSRVSKDRCSRR